MNEAIFLFHLFIILSSCHIAWRSGKEALIAWIVVLPIFANLFVLKTITLFGLNVTCSDAYIVGAMLGLNLLQEYHGKECAKQAARLSFYSMIFYVAMSLLHLLYIPSSQDTTQNAYQMILTPAPRLVVASIITFLVVQWIDRGVFGYLKTRFSSLSLTIRNIISLFLSQFLDTLLFTLLGLLGLVAAPFEVFVVSFTIKCSIAFILALLTPGSERNALSV